MVLRLPFSVRDRDETAFVPSVFLVLLVGLNTPVVLRDEDQLISTLHSWSRLGNRVIPTWTYCVCFRYFCDG